MRKLPLVGISGIGNLLASIKLARYCELSGNDVVVTILTDSLELYGSRLAELTRRGRRLRPGSGGPRARGLPPGQRTDNVLELTQRERRRVHNLKYYTWVEQQGKTAEELTPSGRTATTGGDPGAGAPLDEMITEFNREVGNPPMSIRYACVTCGRRLLQTAQCIPARMLRAPGRGRFSQGHPMTVFQPREEMRPGRPVDPALSSPCLSRTRLPSPRAARRSWSPARCAGAPASRVSF